MHSLALEKTRAIRRPSIVETLEGPTRAEDGGLGRLRVDAVASLYRPPQVHGFKPTCCECAGLKPWTVMLRCMVRGLNGHEVCTEELFRGQLHVIASLVRCGTVALPNAPARARV
jgi:hypothetical protein